MSNSSYSYFTGDEIRFIKEHLATPNMDAVNSARKSVGMRPISHEVLIELYISTALVRNWHGIDKAACIFRAEELLERIRRKAA